MQIKTLCFDGDAIAFFVDASTLNILVYQFADYWEKTQSEPLDTKLLSIGEVPIGKFFNEDIINHTEQNKMGIMRMTEMCMHRPSLNTCVLRLTKEAFDE